MKIQATYQHQKYLYEDEHLLVISFILLEHTLDLFNRFSFMLGTPIVSFFLLACFCVSLLDMAVYFEPTKFFFFFFTPYVCLYCYVIISQNYIWFLEKYLPR